jgi:hypothetical protein
MLQSGEQFKLNEDALQNYGEKYRDIIFTVKFVSTSKKDHPGYDNSMKGMPLYDANGFPGSVYQYEIEEV